MDEVLQDAEKLGLTIQKSEAYRKVKNLENSITANPEAAKAIAAYMAAQEEVRNIVAEGDPQRIAEAGEKLEAAQNQMDAVPAVVELRSARQDYNQMMENVNRVLSLILDGKTEESSGCTGNCASCGGCH